MNDIDDVSLEYDDDPPCSSRLFFKNDDDVDATATAAVGSANSSASAAGLSREADDVDDATAPVAIGSAYANSSSSAAFSRETEAASAGVAKKATIVGRRMNRLVVVFIVCVMVVVCWLL